ncbi:MAG: acetyl-CoA C-acyltransferase [Gemmatimonadota bacterium]
MAETRPVYLLPGLRSPFTRMDRELSRYDAMRLSIPVVQQTVAGPRGTGLDRSGDVDMFVWGAVVPNIEISNWAREIWLDSGLDPHVPAWSVVQQCATSLAAATQAAAAIRVGRGELALCGGVDSMSDTPIGLSKGLSRALRRAGSARGAGAVFGHLRAIRPGDVRLAVPAVKERATGKSMGEHCEEMAKRWRIEREEQDRYSVASHRKAVAAGAEGFFRPLLVAPGTFPVDADTLPRADTSFEALSALRPVFDRQSGTLTAGNSSPLTDGAASCWVTGEAGLGRLPDSLPRVRLLDWEQAAIDPHREGLLIAPAIAIPRLLRRNGLSYGQIDLWEIHEAFAAQVLCTIAALEDQEWLAEHAKVTGSLGPFPRDRVNPNGGSIPIGHPFGATGARILSQCAIELAGRSAGTKAVVSVCAAGGLGHVALLEAL